MSHLRARGVLPRGTEEGVPVLAPAGFLEHAVSENVYAGNAMTRRARYLYGDRLAKAPDGQIGAGLGMTTSTGTITLIPPTVDITHTGQEEVLDGVRIVFQLTLGTLTKPQLLSVLAGGGIDGMDGMDGVEQSGDASLLGDLFAVLVEPDTSFPIVTP